MSATWKEEEINSDDLVLDSDNPRFYHLKHLHGRTKLAQDELEKEIENDIDFLGLVEQIRLDGVRDPIWVVDQGHGKYIVIEGNMRTVSLKRLLREKAVPPKGVSYRKVKANVFSPNTPKPYLAIQRTILQRGKKPWGAFNDAANIYSLRTSYRMSEDEIAQKLSLSSNKVREIIQNFTMYVEFTRKTNTFDPDKFSYFSYAPKQIRTRFFKTEKDRNTFYALLVPDKKGKTRIRSYGTRGGLKDFAKVAENETLLKRFLSKPDMEVADAYEELTQGDIKMTLPFLKKLPSVASGLRGLNSEQVQAIRSDTRLLTQLKAIYRAIDKVIS
jgi:hypothetical protein